VADFANTVLKISKFHLDQWFPNCGTRRPSRWYARPFCSSTPVFLNPDSVDPNESAEGSGWVCKHQGQASLLWCLQTIITVLFHIAFMLLR